MSRFLRSTPPQPKFIDPTVVFVRAVVGTPGQLVLQTYGFAARQRPAYTARRFPEQGWQGGAISLPAKSLVTLAASPTTANFALLGSGSLDVKRAAPFAVGAAAYLQSVEVALRRSGSPTDSIQISIQTDSGGAPDGVPLTSVALLGSTLPIGTSGRLLLEMPLDLAAGNYWVVFERTGALDVSNNYLVNTAPPNSGLVFNTGAWVATQAPFAPAALSFQASLGTPVRLLGPRPPQIIGALPTSQQTTLAVALASGLFTNQRRAQQRRTISFFTAQPPAAATAFVAPPLSVNLASGLFTNQRRAQQRRTLSFGSKLLLVQPDSTFVASPIEVTLAKRNRPPKITSALLPVAVIAQSFFAPPLSVNCLQPDRLSRRYRRMPSQSSLNPPTVLAVFGGPNVATVAVRTRTRPRRPLARLAPPATLTPYSVELAEATLRVTLVHTRPRLTDKSLSAPTIIRVPSAEQREQTISVSLTRTRPRPTTRRLGPPTTLAIFAGPTAKLVRSRPRPTRHYLYAPTVVRVPSVEQREQTITVKTVRVRPRRTISHLAAPTTLSTFSASRVVSVRVARRHTISRLAPPAVVTATAALAQPTKVTLAPSRVARSTAYGIAPPLLTEQTPTYQQTTILESFARTRPRRTQATLRPPVAVAAAQQTRPVAVTLVRTRPRKTVADLPLVIFATQPLVETTPQVVVVRTRPRPTARRLYKPTVLQVFAAGRTTLAKTRPHHTLAALHSPTVVRVPSVDAREQTIMVTLVRARPRHTFSVVKPPTVLATFATGKSALTKTLPRPTRHTLTPPTVVRVPSVEQQEDTIRVSLARTRPRHTGSALRVPTVLQTFAGPIVHTTQIRPRPTATFLTPPTVVRVPSVEQQEDTIRVSLVRSRPRTTVKALFEPAVLQTFAFGKPSLVRARPRPTDYRLLAPTVIRVPSVEQAEQTIRSTLDRTRPRPTIHVLGEPTVLRVPSVEQREQTITVKFVATRPRPTTKKLAPPTKIIVNPPVVTTILVQKVAVRTRIEQRRHVVEHFLRAPQVVIPLPTLRVQTIDVHRIRIRPRRTLALLRKPTVLQVFDAGAPTLVRARPLKVTSRSIRPATLEPFSVELREQTIEVALVRIRPRHTLTRLYKPTALQVFASSETPLVRIRPPKTKSILSAPATLEPYAVDLAERTIHTALVRTRPSHTISRFPQVAVLARASFAFSPKAVATRLKRTHSLLRAPIVLRPIETTVKTTFAHVTRRAVHSELPKVAARFVARPIEVSLARSTRPLANSRLAPPTALATALAEQIHAHVRTRVPLVQSFLASPTVVTTNPPVVTTISVTSVAIRDRLKRHDYLHRLPLVIGPSLTAEPCFIASGHDRPSAISAGEESRGGASGSTTSADGASPPRTSAGGASGYSTPGGLAGGEEC